MRAARLPAVTMSIALALGAVACSSDSKSAATTSATTVPASSAASTPATSDTTAGTTTLGTTPGDTTPPTNGPVTSAGDKDRATVVAYESVQAAQLGYNLDGDCLAKVVAKLSDADAALIAASTLDTAPDATQPVISPAGEQLGSTALDCTKVNTDTTLIKQAAAVVEQYQGAESLDPACVEKTLTKFTSAELQLVIDSGPETTDAKLRPVAFELFDCVPTTSTT
ncbi:MAG: hypothetical protein JWM34_3693 [Ilumatobacteraceae bacterium]|nr:hypothetical protein [Ilumatobacteraceae bacterium]